MRAGREEFLPKHNNYNHWKTEITSPVCLAFWNFYSYFDVNQFLASQTTFSHMRREGLSLLKEEEKDSLVYKALHLSVKRSLIHPLQTRMCLVLRRSSYPPQNMPLWGNNYFKLIIF